MRPYARILALAALLLLPVACAEQGDAVPEASAAPKEAVPVAFRLTVTGASGPVLPDGARGEVSFLRKGAKEPLAVAFESGSTVVHPLPPGRYSLAGIGPLACRGLDFEVGPASPRALGTLNAKIIETDYYVALMSGRKATGTELADLARETGTAAEGIDARPLGIPESAPCFVSKSGPGQTWHDRPLGEKILIGIGFAAFCALAVTQGGICAF